MKNLLLFFSAVAFCLSLTAQPYTARDFMNVSKKAYKVQAYGASETENDKFVPALRQSNFSPKSATDVYPIGTTYYVTVSNANARNTINWSPDGKTCAAVWTMGPSSQKQRGTGINYYTVNDGWGPIPSLSPLERIEQSPKGTPGWGTHVFTEQGECVVAHSSSAGGIYVNTRDEYGEGEWQQYLLKGPAGDGGSTVILWPTLCAAGNTLHMVCVTDTDDELNGVSSCPIYYRSKDGGKTWENYRTFDGLLTPYEINVISADDYVATAVGDHVVIAFIAAGVVYLESFDGGDTWTRNLVYDCEFDWETDDAVPPTMYATSVAVAIGDEGVVHIAFSTSCRVREAGIGSWYYQYFPTLSGLFTWKEGKPVITQEDMGLEYNNDFDILDFNFDKLPYFLDAPDLLGFEKFYFWSEDADMLVNDCYGNPGYISQPRLLAADGKVYLTYSSIIEEPMIYSGGASDQFYRGVFCTVSHDNGETYNQKENTSWLSYGPDIFLCDWSDYGGPIKETEDEIEYDGEIELLWRSENGFPSMSVNIKNDQLVLTWLNNYFPGIDGPWSGDLFTVLAANIKDVAAGVYQNTGKIWQGYGVTENNNKPIISKIYPNPAIDVAVIELNTFAPYTLSVSNIMGQEVYSTKGNKNRIELNVSNYPSGVYIINITTKNATASQKLIIK